ncbi:hypothetical protein PRK78_001173 [Emydomyces testavorans]|uniref:Uncharacterized protein n=1 Tax=Emydomyces testavorans TaxID=2070801 RepID=A0AAF0DCH1_9EURO|nr:hypothetical protein PRK78_001173 [Emydomyces testavorans]
MPKFSRKGFCLVPKVEDRKISKSNSDAEEALLSPSSDSSSFNLLSIRFLDQNRRSRWKNLRNPTILLTALNILLFVFSFLLLLSPIPKTLCLSRLSDHDKWKATSFYSPILDRFEIPRIEKTANGTLYDTYPPSLLRIAKGPKADAEWFRIGSGVFPLVISSAEIHKLGKDVSLAVKIPEQHGFGPDAYLAQTEVFHLLHCLDMLRKEISYEHYYFPKYGKTPDAEHNAHISHCIDILAQSIKCTSSTDVILFNWVEGWDQPFPDFTNKHVCKDFDALLEYVNENSVPVKVFQAMKEPPEGYVRLPEPALAKASSSDNS